MQAFDPLGGDERRRLGDELRKRFRWLTAFSDDELQKISMCKLDEGDPQEDDLYFDISHPERGTFRGQAGKVVPEGSCYVSRGQLSESVWNKLIGFQRGH